MAKRKITIEIEVKKGASDSEIQNLKKQVEDLGVKAKVAANDGISSLTRNLIGLAAGAASIATVKKGVDLLFQSLSRASELEGLTQSFDKLQSSIGNLADEKIAALRQATRGLLTDQELLQSANQAVLLGVDKGAGGFEKLTAAALKLGRAQGITAKQAIDSLTTGIGRQSRLVLDNLGVIVKAEQAYEDFARANNTTVEALTGTQRQAAFTAAAVASITEKAAGLSEVQDTAAIAADRLSVAQANLFDRFSTGISQSEGLAEALNEVAATMDEIDIEGLATGLATIAAVAIRTANAILQVATSIQFLATLVPSLTASMSTLPFAATAKEAEATAKKISLITSSLKATDKNVTKTKVLFAKLVLTLERLKKAGVTSNISVRKLGKAIADFEKKVPKASKSVKVLDDEIGKLGKGKGASGIDELTKKLEALQSVIDRVGKGSIQTMTSQVEDAQAAFEAGSGDVESLRSELEFLAAIAGTDKQKIDELAAAIDALPANKTVDIEVNQTITEGGSLPKGKGAKGILGKFFKGSADGSIAKAIDNSLQDVGGILANALLNGGSGKDTGAAIGSRLGSEFGPIGEIVGNKLGGAIGQSISSAFKKAFGGKNNKAANARESFFKFLDQIFDENGAQVIIEDKLVKLGDIFENLSRHTFDPGAIGNPFESLENLSEGAQNAFIQTGNALTFILREVDDAFNDLPEGQAGALLADRLSGDLNALQVLVQSTGISFEELGKAMVDAALKGEVSFLDAQVGLQQLGELAQNGIPGKIGAIKEAFDNMAAAGRKGGIATVDGLRDIGAEALELQINSLPALQSALINAGADAGEVEKVFASLGEIGVTSVEDLANITDEKAVAVLANLDAIGFNFAEVTSEAADDLISKLENIPDTIESTIKINVETNALDVGAQQLIDSGNLGLAL